MVKSALVGCGHIAAKHAEAIASIASCELYAVCDMVVDNMRPYQDRFGVAAYEQYDEMLKDNHVDLVHICTPSGTHASLAIKAAQAGKHIVLEKPMALTERDAVAIIEACKKYKVKLSVVHPNRFRPAMIALKSLLDRGLFGKLSHANATVRWNRNAAYYAQAAWRGTKSMDGGVLMNQAIHNLDLLIWLMGPVAEVQAYTATRYRKIESEDVAAAVVRFRSGALGIIEAATTIYPKNLEESISIFGEKGSAVVRGVHANKFEHLIVEGMNEDERNFMMNAGERQEKSGHAWIIEDMVHSILEDREPIVSGKDGLDAVRLVLAISEASDTTKPIILVPMEGDDDGATDTTHRFETAVCIDPR